MVVYAALPVDEEHLLVVVSPSPVWPVIRVVPPASMLLTVPVKPLPRVLSEVDARVLTEAPLTVLVRAVPRVAIADLAKLASRKLTSITWNVSTVFCRI